MNELRIGKKFFLGKALDNWVIEAGGSTARVFQASAEDYQEPVAIKIMAPAWIRYSLPRFIEEIRVMCQIRDMKWATHPLEFGFLSLDALPLVDRKNDVWLVSNPTELQGTLRRIGLPHSGRFSHSQPEVQSFINQLTDYYGKVKSYFEEIHKERDVELSDDEWLKVFTLIDRSMPYIVFEKRGTIFLEPISDPKDTRPTKLRNWKKASDPSLNEVNLLLLCDEGHVYENLLPVKKGVSIAIQICDIMAAAHEKNVVFSDHKVLHYYWNNLYEHVYVIDWNMGQYFPEGLSVSEKKFDLIQFSARALFHILTGHQVEKALDIGRTEYQQLDDARRNHVTYKAGWKNGEKERLGSELINILEHGISGGFNSFEELKIKLNEVQ